MAPRLRFVSGIEAAVCGNAAIIADLHLGMERLLFARGVRASGVSERITEKTVRLLEKTKKKKLIIAGDVKENVVGVEKEVREYFEQVCGLAEIIVVKGNHDGGIEKIPGIEVVPAGGLVFGKLGIVHGHAWPFPEVMECERILMGHNHPQMKFGSRWEPVWMEIPPEKNKIIKKYPSWRGKSKLVLMPSFNPLLGTNIAGMEGLGPLLKNKLFKIDAAIVYTLGGARIGRPAKMF